MRLRTLAHATVCLAMISPASARLLITEVIPGVTLTQTNGDKVELFNTGPGPVDLTGWVLTDLDTDALESNPLAEGTFAPASLSVPPLGAGQFCVITFVDPAAPAGDNSGVTAQPYGLSITVELEPGLTRNTDAAVLLDPSGNIVDCVVYGSPADTPASDPIGDLRALTLPDNNGYGFTGLSSTSGWTGPDGVTLATTYATHAVQLTPPLDTETATGSGSIQRINVGPFWMEGDPDGADFFVVTDVTSSTIGAHTFSTADGTVALRTRTNNLTTYLTNLDASALDRPKIATTQDDDIFDIPTGLDRTRFRFIFDLMLAGDFPRANFYAPLIDYEVVQWNDTTSGDVWYILMELDNADEANFHGWGTYVFDPDTVTRLAIEVPHVIFDSLTHEEGAAMLLPIRPRVLMVAGAHRRNSTVITPCDGTDSGGQPYRISDPSHSIATVFHVAHEQYTRAFPSHYTVQLHGFSQATWGAEPIDVIISEGIAYTPPLTNFSQVLKARINAQNFFADGTDLTVAGVYNADVNFLGAGTTTEGRYTNGVQWALACTSSASTSSGRFIHIEQDLDVRQEPQHIITALLETIGQLGIPAGLTLLGPD